MSKIRVFGMAQESIVDGPGLRFAVFTQGCPHHCPGCHNPGSHDMEGGTLYTVDELVRLSLANPLCRGLTLSGGEPFAQAEACAELAARVRAAGKDVWIYSGYTFEALRDANNASYDALLAACDVLVDGPFEQARRSLSLRFRGSVNQRLIDMKRTLETGAICQWRGQDAQSWAFVPARSAVG